MRRQQNISTIDFREIIKLREEFFQEMLFSMHNSRVYVQQEGEQIPVVPDPELNVV